MNNIQRILVPIDFTQRSQNGLNQAVQLAMRSGAKLYLFHAYSRPVVPELVTLQNTDLSTIQKTYLRKKERQIEQQFEELIFNTPHIEDVKYEVVKKLDKSVKGIVTAIHHFQPDLVMMASKGVHGLDELWGSKTAKVVEVSDVPVLAIPDHAELKQIKKIGYACNYSYKSDPKTLAILPILAKLFRVQLHIINVADNPEQHGSHEFEEASLLHELLADVQHSFDYVFDKNIQKGLVDYCKENQIGLLAVMPHSRGFFERIFRESLTKQMVYHIDMPLLILK